MAMTDPDPYGRRLFAVPDDSRALEVVSPPDPRLMAFVTAGDAHARLAAAIMDRANLLGAGEAGAAVAAIGFAHADQARQWLDLASDLK